MRVFAKEVLEKVKELDEEKKKTEKAFHDILPPSVVRDIKNKKVKVTIYTFDQVKLPYEIAHIKKIFIPSR